MKLQIIGNASIVHVKGKGDVFYVFSVFSYLDDEYSITVLVGWITDGASVPRPFWSVFPPIAGKYLEAAIIHDILYKSQVVSRRKADKIFLRAMKACGVRIWKRWIIYLAVRCCGWVAWRKNKNKADSYKKYVEVLNLKEV